MKNLIVVLAFIILGITLVNGFILGDSEDTYQGAIGGVMNTNISKLRNIP